MTACSKVSRCAPWRSIPWLLFSATVVGFAPDGATFGQDDGSNTGGSAPGARGRERNLECRTFYQERCGKCHGNNGRGVDGRGLFPEIPDFTDAAWHKTRTDAHLRVSILEGKGNGMPGWAAKMTKERAAEMAALIRSFAPNKQKEDKGAPARFEVSFHRLQQDFEELQKALGRLAETRGRGASQDNKPRPATGSAGQASFLKHCVKCHEPSGRGGPARKLFPETPDFTDAAWQTSRTDAQLLTSILEGKGKGMPDWKSKLTKEQARALVAHIRSLSAKSKKPPPREGQ